MRPEISVIMPTYNCENFVALAVDSVMNQSYTNFELIIIDGGSTDATISIVRSYRDHRVKIVECSGMDIAESRNLGLTMAKGDLIALHDADDLSDPRRFAMQFQSFLDDEKLVVIGSSLIKIDDKGDIIRKVLQKKKVDFLDLKEGNQIGHGSVMFRRKVILGEGSYDPFFIQAEDYELWCRLAKKGYKIMNLSEFLYYYRVHQKQISSEKWKENMLYACLVHDIYFGGLMKDKLSQVKKKSEGTLYSMLSVQMKSKYHRLLLFHNFLHAPSNVIKELIILIRLDPVNEICRLRFLFTSRQYYFESL
jgi:glycosyltransferase involved in cell wall biosynthesis